MESIPKTSVIEAVVRKLEELLDDMEEMLEEKPGKAEQLMVPLESVECREVSNQKVESLENKQDVVDGVAKNNENEVLDDEIAMRENRESGEVKDVALAQINDEAVSGNKESEEVEDCELLQKDEETLAEKGKQLVGDKREREENGMIEEVINEDDVENVDDKPHEESIEHYRVVDYDDVQEVSEDVQELMTSTRRRMYWNLKAFVMKAQSNLLKVIHLVRLYSHQEYCAEVCQEVKCSTMDLSRGNIRTKKKYN